MKRKPTKRQLPDLLRSGFGTQTRFATSRALLLFEQGRLPSEEDAPPRTDEDPKRARPRSVSSPTSRPAPAAPAVTPLRVDGPST